MNETQELSNLRGFLLKICLFENGKHFLPKQLMSRADFFQTGSPMQNGQKISRAGALALIDDSLRNLVWRAGNKFVVAH